jgi:ABC-type multidrug transport system ATPase subunit
MSGNGRGAGAPALLARGLAKSYGQVRAVRDISIEARRGEIYGFLGRNGAGKTTTIRMILGLVRPDEGEIEILGSSLRRDRAGVLSRVGYLVESAAAYPKLSVLENLELQRRLTRSPKAAAGAAMETLGLEQYSGRLAGRLSLGNKQRLSIARALVHRPELLILDEPANGLDPAGIIEIRALLKRLAHEEGVTIFMSSHLLDEVEQLADRIGIVHEGRLVEEAEAADLSARSLRSVEIEVDDPGKAEAALREFLGLRAIERSGERALRVTDPLADPAAIARTIVGAGLGLSRLVAGSEDLESHFMRLTGGSL